MNKIRKGDQVIVIAGKYKGQRGEVLRVALDRVFVQNINLIKRHTKPNPQANQPGGIVEREASIHISNVMLFNAAANKAIAWASRRSTMGARSARSARPAKWLTREGLDHDDSP